MPGISNLEAKRMYKILQLKQAIGCFYKMEVRQKGLKGFQGLASFFEFWIGEFMFFILLAVSIHIGDTTIPSYQGDGYSFDNFARKEGDEPEYNYWLHCYIGNNGEIGSMRSM